MNLSPDVRVLSLAAAPSYSPTQACLKGKCVLSPSHGMFITGTNKQQAAQEALPHFLAREERSCLLVRLGIWPLNDDSKWFW